MMNNVPVIIIHHKKSPHQEGKSATKPAYTLECKVNYSQMVKLVDTILARERDKVETRSGNADQTVNKLSCRFESYSDN